MHWADALPNLVIGLREGLEAGLVVSILLAALRRVTPDGDRRGASAPIWLGVLAAVMVAGSFAAVLTYSTSVVSSQAQQAIGGLLSILAVALVTGMIFWMRRTAASLSGELRGRVAHAALIGAGALTMTAFVAVGREGLETTLFLWTAVRASGQTVSPLVGAGLGLVAAVVLCALLYRSAITINLGVFFSRTAVALIVIAAGVLSYGLGDLQDAGWLPGQRWIALDLSAHLDPNAWWVAIISGVTDLAPKLTVLQVLAWSTYLVVVLGRFLASGRRVHATAVVAATAPAAATAAISGGAARRARVAMAARWESFAGRRPWRVAGVLVVVPAVAATAVIAVLPSASAASNQTVTVTNRSCASDWTGAHTGSQTFAVTNSSDQAGEINLVNASGGVVAEVETIGPATTAQMSASLAAGSYSFVCSMGSHRAMTSAAVQVSGPATATAPAAVKPIRLQELVPANEAYQSYVAQDLTVLERALERIHRALAGGNRAAAKTAWLAAQLDWERVGASYDSFGDAGVAIDGLPDGLRDGVRSRHFTGLHRLEYGLWHGEALRTLLAQNAVLAKDVAALGRHVHSDDIAGDPTNLPIRAHEILEDALRDHLSGIDDEGAGAAYPETAADLQVTRRVLGELSPQIAARAAALPATLDAEMNALSTALLATRGHGGWRSIEQTPLRARQQVDAAIGALLQSLSEVPDLLEVPPTH